MKIKMRYFASLRENLGTHEEELELGVDKSLQAVSNLLKSRGLSERDMKRVRFAVNHEFRDLDFILNEADEVALIPPVTGG